MAAITEMKLSQQSQEAVFITIGYSFVVLCLHAAPDRSVSSFPQHSVFLLQVTVLNIIPWAEISIYDNKHIKITSYSRFL